MIKELSFKEIRKYLEEKSDTAILDAFDKFADVAIIFAPVALGPQFLPLLELLDIKDRMVDIGRSIVNYVVSKQEPEYIKRAEQIRISYALIVYTSYLETFYNNLPEDIIKKLKTKLSDKKIITKIATSNDTECEDLYSIYCKIPYADHVMSFSETMDSLKQIYDNISTRFLNIIIKTEIYENGSKKIEKISQAFKDIAEKSIIEYEAQYLFLADKFNDFGFYAQTLELQSIYRQNTKHLEILKLISSATQHIDVGLNTLHSIVTSLPTDFTSIQAQDIIEDITKKYRALIEQPIIDNDEISSRQEDISLTFPKIVDAFIPQSYKCLSYIGKDIHLEDEETWKSIKTQNDLGRFFVRYLFTADSIDYPLVILGHPGSGKSLLTKVLSAQLMSNSYTVIRIPLREINADLGIDILVEEQIKKLTSRPLIDGYGGFAKQFKEKPLLIILDGYDELLQAKGEVFAGYLEKARRFQQDQKDLNRPVRIIVTSRITLIDKAIVPINATILRLMEFNEEQRNRWINIWNNANISYFKSQSPEIQPFSLPRETQKNRSRILELAEQPLLLLMLALYDSEDNSLKKLENDLKRTVLYNNLLRRFVRRERGRYVNGFNEMEPLKQEEFIDIEMKRLGVVAIGMYNRKTLHINTEQLDNDLHVFDSNREESEQMNRKLKDSESLLGGFFFIHQSTAQDISANSNNTDSAFEFLHNTFGEFLTADMILRYAIQETQVLDLYKKNAQFINELNKKLKSPDGLCKEWFACLMFTPLFSRPVVLEMIGEHISHALKSSGLSEQDFAISFEEIVKSQINIILGANTFPRVMTQKHGISNHIPLLGFISIYTMNLIILASVLLPNGFVFDETDYIHQNISNSEAKPWDKLTYLWRTWFSAENLTGLAVVLKAKRANGKIVISRCERYEAKSYKQPIDIQLCVSSTIADYLNVGLAGLQTQNFSNIVMMDDYSIASMLKEENEELYFSFLLNCLRKAKSIHYKRIDYDNINDWLCRIIKNTDLNYINTNTVMSFLEVIQSCISEKLVYFETKRYLYEFLYDYITQPKSSKIIVEIAIVVMCYISGYTFPFLFRERRIHNIQLFREPFIDVDENIFIKQRNLIMDSYNRYDSIYGIDRVQKRLLNIVLNESIPPKTKVKDLIDILHEANIESLIKSNPTLLSQVFMALAQNSKTETIYYDIFINIIRDAIKKIGVPFVGYDATINCMKLLIKLNRYDLLDEVAQEVHTTIFGGHSEPVIMYLVTNPKVITELVDIYPKIFMGSKEYFKYLTRELFTDKLYEYSIEALPAYVHIIRKIYDISHLDLDTVQLLGRYFYDNTKRIVASCNFKNMNIHELDDMHWFAELTNNDILIKHINKIMDV